MILKIKKIDSSNGSRIPVLATFFNPQKIELRSSKYNNRILIELFINNELYTILDGYITKDIEVLVFEWLSKKLELLISSFENEDLNKTFMINLIDGDYSYVAFEKERLENEVGS